MITQPTERIQEQRVRRSATAVTDAKQTTIYLGVCDVHNVPVRESKLGLYPHMAPKHSRVLCFIAEEHEILGEKLIAVETTLTCDGSCRSARGRSCSCGCGGINHGDRWTRQYMLDHREMFESEVAKYRYEMQQLELKREQRAATKAEQKRQAFEAWMTGHAEDVEFFMNADNIRSNFLRSMKEQLGTMKPLTEGQLRVVLQIRTEQAERQAQWAERDAERRQYESTSRPGQGDQSQLTVGVYQLGENIYVLAGNGAYRAWRKQLKDNPELPRPEAARLYAKQWIKSAARVSETDNTIYGSLEYARGVIFKIAPEDRMPLERAEAWSMQFGQCIVCGARLKAEDSVRRGIGPVCRKYFS